MSPKEYLQQAYRIECKIALDKELVESMRAALHGRSANYSSDGSQHILQENNVERAILRVVEYENKINAEIEDLMCKRLEIEDVIDTISNEILQEVLKRRYLLYQKWDEIAEEMHYGEQWVHKLHNRALAEVKEAIVSEYKLVV